MPVISFSVVSVRSSASLHQRIVFKQINKKQTKTTITNRSTNDIVINYA